jgi:hypothetical protein
MFKTMGWSCGLAVLVFFGCADSDNKQQEQAELGTLAFPLTSQSPSGTQYRLRNATFAIQRPWYDCYEYGVAGSGTVGGNTNACSPISVSSETDPNASSIAVDLEEGSYDINLLPGWSMERVDNGVATQVEAQLISSSQQWGYVSRHSTSWVSFQFGIGDYAVWFNGKLNIQIQVYDNPEQLYGPLVGGAAGMPSTASGGIPWGGATY